MVTDTKALATTSAPQVPEVSPAGIVERVVIEGDLSKLTPAERVSYYLHVCRSLALNPATRPFDYITLNGKLVLYARKDATDQIRNNKKVSIYKLEREAVNEVYVVTAYAQIGDRTDSSIGAVSISGLKGADLANAMMKAETKAKRRVTLSIVGLGMLDETEVETIADSRPADVDVETGEIRQTKAAARGGPTPPVSDERQQLITDYQTAARAAVRRGMDEKKAKVKPDISDADLKTFTAHLEAFVRGFDDAVKAEYQAAENAKLADAERELQRVAQAAANEPF